MTEAASPKNPEPGTSNIEHRTLNLEQSIAVIGAGYWGKNLVRNFYQLGVLKTICDGAQSIREEMAKTYPSFSLPESGSSISPPLDGGGPTATRLAPSPLTGEGRGGGEENRVKRAG